jgi:hypothetical protein
MGGNHEAKYVGGNHEAKFIHVEKSNIKRWKEHRSLVVLLSYHSKYAISIA